MRSFQFRRTQRKYKTPYKVTNWRAYEVGLRQRGSLTLWIAPNAANGWCHSGRRWPGGQRIYSDIAIETLWTVAMIYGLPLRQAEGFIESLFELGRINLPVPDHTTVSRRFRKLRKPPMSPLDRRKPIHLLVDSTGVSIHVGHARKPPKRRGWRKIHLAVDRDSADIMAVDLTASNARDAARVPALLSQVDTELASFSGDGAYDKDPVYQSVEAHSSDSRTRVIIPPQKGALPAPKSVTAMQDRNRHIRSINQIGRRRWHLQSGFTKRSTVENVVYRYKTIIGPDMKARTLAGQRVEARLGCQILNRMAELGMPETRRLA